MIRDRVSGKIIFDNKKYDFAIIGGGATGIGILLEAVTRGYSAILLEASDFTKSTSSKSTKLVHGGVRYLAQGNLGLVREACIERGRLKNNAPHIVKDQTFIIPVYSFFDEILYTLGLKFYDLLAGNFSLGPSARITRKKTLSELPALNPMNLRAGIRYHDGQFDDSRLAMSLLQTAITKGAAAINYMPVTGLLKNDQDKLTGVKTKDLIKEELFTIEADHIVNATGVFADEIMHMDKPGMKRTIQPSQGIHLVISGKFLPGDHALMIPKTKDGRVLFAVPWLGKVVVGTTDTPIEKASLEPEAMEEEIKFILDTASKYLTKSPSRKDVLSVFTGLRPLAAVDDSEKTKEISRSHKIMVSDSGLLTIIGGKWTTYRKMAEDLVHRAEKNSGLPPTRSVTAKLKLSGYKKQLNPSDPLCLYGKEADKIKEIQQEPGYSGMISEKLKIFTAQIVYAVRHEMAVKPEDILARRTRALLLDAREAIKIARPVAEIMAKELKKDKTWVVNEVKDFEILAKKYILH